MKKMLQIGVLVFCIFSLAFFAALAFFPASYDQLEMLDYLNSGENQPIVGVNEDSHMRDVFHILSGARILSALGFVGLFFLLPIMGVAALRVSAFATLAILVTSALLPWNLLFDGMHAVLFPQGNWTFPASSPLIQIYPMDYFVGFAICWASLSALIALILLASSKLVDVDV